MDRVTAEAESEGLLFNLDRARRSNTANAHRMLVLAEQQGVQLELKERLMKAYFTDGLEVGSVEGLASLGAEIGMEPELTRAWLAGDDGRSEVADQLMFAADAGIHSVPTFVIDRSIGIPGAQPPEVFTEILERSLESARPS